MSAKSFVEHIADNTIVIFSKVSSPYANGAKTLFAQKYTSTKAKAIELDQVAGGKDIQDHLQKKTGQRAVPNIFINGKSVGGYTDVVQLDQ